MEAGVATVAVSGMEVLMEMTVDLYVTSVIYIHVGSAVYAIMMQLALHSIAY